MAFLPLPMAAQFVLSKILSTDMVMHGAWFSNESDTTPTLPPPPVAELQDGTQSLWYTQYWTNKTEQTRLDIAKHIHAVWSMFASEVH